MRKILFNFIYVVLLLALAGCTFVAIDDDRIYNETPSAEENNDEAEIPFDPEIIEDEVSEAPQEDEIPTETNPQNTDLDTDDTNLPDDTEIIDPAYPDETPTETDPEAPDLDADDTDLPDDTEIIDPANPDEAPTETDSEAPATSENPIEEPNEEIIIESHLVRFYVENVVYYETIFDTFELILKPIDPTKTNHKFSGWYLSDKILFDFSQPVLEDINLYAYFELDYILIINLLATEYMSTNVEITARHWNTAFPNREVDVIGALGSGVIFSIKDDTYYVLTNNHVIYAYGRTNHEYKIKDYKGNIYTAQLYVGSNQAAYDLAILYFTKQDEDLKVSRFAESNPKVTETILSLGQPGGQDNTFTIGQVTSYRKITISGGNTESSNVQFEVIRHNAPIAAGSSGGVILNTSFELVGINFAGLKDGAFDLNAIGYAIPLEKVLEYLMFHFNEPIVN
jgi:S1-C subfamily serine protease